MSGAIDDDGDDEYGANHDALPGGGNTDEIETVAKHAHDHRADQGADNAAFAAHQADAADDRSGDGVQLVHFAGQR